MAREKADPGPGHVEIVVRNRADNALDDHSAFYSGFHSPSRYWFLASV